MDDEDFDCCACEMLRSLSDELDREPSGSNEDFSDLFNSASLGDGPQAQDIDLFERVGRSAESEDDCRDSAVPNGDSPGIFLEEYAMLSSVYDVCEMNQAETCIRVQVMNPGSLANAIERRGRKSKGVFVNIVRSSAYPLIVPEIALEPWHNLFTADEVHFLYTRLREHAEAMKGNPLLVAICSEAAEVCDSMIRFGGVPNPPAQASEVSKMHELGIRAREISAGLSPSVYVGSVGDLISKIPRCFDVVNASSGPSRSF
jgi:hypothetical protein